MRVLVLRPDDGALRTAARLKALGHEAIASPVMETAPTGAPRPAGAFDGVIATSAQAFRWLNAGALAPFVALPLACVGARTAQAARDAGFARIMWQAPDAASLAERLARDHAGKSLLYLAGQDRKSDFEQRLAAANIRVTPWVAYEARPLATLREEAIANLRTGGLDAALHFSRRSAALFCQRVAQAHLEDEARKILHVAISADAASGLAQLAPPRVQIAAAPNEERMLEELGRDGLFAPDDLR